jgi:hypothetical protein
MQREGMMQNFDFVTKDMKKWNVESTSYFYHAKKKSLLKKIIDFINRLTKL